MGLAMVQTHDQLLWVEPLHLPTFPIYMSYTFLHVFCWMSIEHWAPDQTCFHNQAQVAEQNLFIAAPVVQQQMYGKM